MYEWLDPVHVHLRDPEGREFDGIGARDSYSAEKEAGLYVDFDPTFGSFVHPSWRVPPVEAIGRILTLGALALTAQSVYRAIQERDSALRADAVSRHMRLLWVDFKSQEDMASALELLARESEAHASLVADLKSSFKSNREVLRAMRLGAGLDGPDAEPSGDG